jgi:hypothetical protein
MPVHSKAQQAFAFANPDKFGGKAKVESEWAQHGAAYRALPARVGKKHEKHLRHVTRPRSS